MEMGYFIGGVQRRSQKSVRVINPYDGSLAGTTYLVADGELEEAVEKAQEGFVKTKSLAAFKRSAICRHVVCRLREEKESFARLIVHESGKPLRDALAEVDRATFTFELAAEEAIRLGGEVIPVDVSPLGQGRIGFYQRFPAGILLGITPFNFPLNLVAHKVAPAIAVGNPILLKPAPATPLTALRLAELVLEAGWPREALSVFQCTHEEAGWLVADDRIAVISFTGSDRVGWEIKRRAGKKKVILELGGNAGVIVDQDADLQYAARRCAVGGFSYSGQVCISTQRIFVHDRVYKPFRELLLGEVQGLKVGDPMDMETMVGPLINEASACRIESWIQEAVAWGGRLLLGGTREGNLVYPTVLEQVGEKCAICSEEAFGPVVVLDRFASFEEAIEKVNRSRYGLQCGVFTSNIARGIQAFRELEVGGVIINDIPSFRVDNMPYGGVKDSGLGREGVRFAMEEMSEIKMMVIQG